MKKIIAIATALLLSTLCTACAEIKDNYAQTEAQITTSAQLQEQNTTEYLTDEAENNDNPAENEDKTTGNMIDEITTKPEDNDTASTADMFTTLPPAVDENGYFDIYAVSTEECAAAILFAMTSGERLDKLDPSFNATEMTDVVIDGKAATLYYIVYKNKTVSKMCVTAEGDYYFCDDVSTPEGTYYHAFSSTKGWVIDRDTPYYVE